ncbi:hypothetical protein [Pseudomonas aeruginosa]|uniref:hypothetical protein n=2 Tax=Pseudomonas aeruginosa TaxID=287 RepID=UPI000B49030E|nr:hypothetical protein [Pseudomonas aeruginosa]EKM6335146.1 hypothetical protein [Pseudomonas aeruginosa]EKX0314467.1 hypothetical protein [Pseudomonas aeruginosa]ELF5759326.1 hypothetical protein [Pseudomonas aeruginosa]ELH4229672.1 hypothetical protein [Pseudomonas aeruginosa]MBG6364488.1 hypothetical protein [Pseudomonas aeruginosa]
MTDIREEFEAWHHAEFGYCISEEDDAWNAGECAKRWETWQASRAALRVRLPKPYGSSSLDAYPELAEFNRGIRECLAALQQAGIEVK